jgi:hypothetical protein
VSFEGRSCLGASPSREVILCFNFALLFLLAVNLIFSYCLGDNLVVYCIGLMILDSRFDI